MSDEKGGAHEAGRDPDHLPDAELDEVSGGLSLTGLTTDMRLPERTRTFQVPPPPDLSLDSSLGGMTGTASDAGSLLDDMADGPSGGGDTTGSSRS